MNDMDQHHLPDMNRLSVLAAAIMLAYALSPFIKFPGMSFSIPLPGVVFDFEFSFTVLVSIIAAGMAGTGMLWLLEDHPDVSRRQRYRHLLIPALTAWAIGTPLNTLKPGLEWWIVFLLGGTLLVFVMVAEYIVVDPADIRHAPASVGLTAVSFALFLILAIAVRATGLRLYLAIFALAPAVLLVALRTIFLRTSGGWFYVRAAAIALIVTQFALSLHYWPITPLTYGLMLLGLTYALIELISTTSEGKALKVAWIEPSIILVVLWGLAFIVG